MLPANITQLSNIPPTQEAYYDPNLVSLVLILIGCMATIAVRHTRTRGYAALKYPVTYILPRTPPHSVTMLSSDWLPGFRKQTFQRVTPELSWKENAPKKDGSRALLAFLALWGMAGELHTPVAISLV